MREIIREYCVCKKCGFGYAQVKGHVCYTVMPPIHKAKYHCPVCKFDGEVNENEVFRKKEEITDDGFTSDFEFAEPCPMPGVLGECNDPMPQKLVDDNGKEITINGDTGKGETIVVDPSQDTPFIKVPELSEEDKEKILKYIKENKNYIIKSLKCSIEPLIDINDLIKCIKLMYFCGINDLGALQNGRITQEEFDFMQKIISKIKAGK